MDILLCSTCRFFVIIVYTDLLCGKVLLSYFIKARFCLLIASYVAALFRDDCLPGSFLHSIRKSFMNYANRKLLTEVLDFENTGGVSFK